MEQATSYEDAKTRLQSPRLLAPVYFILAGTRAGEASDTNDEGCDKSIFLVPNDPVFLFLFISDILARYFMLILFKFQLKKSLKSVSVCLWTLDIFLFSCLNLNEI